MAINEQQRLFAKEFVVDFNALQAYIRAGYAKKGAGQGAHRLLNNVELQELIKEECLARARAVEAKAEDVVKELLLLAFSDVKNYVVDEDGSFTVKEGVPEIATRAVESCVYDPKKGKTKIKLWSKPKGLEMLGRYFAMFTDKHEVTGKDGAPMQVQYITIGGKKIEF